MKGFRLGVKDLGAAKQEMSSTAGPATAVNDLSGSAARGIGAAYASGRTKPPTARPRLSPSPTIPQKPIKPRTK